MQIDPVVYVSGMTKQDLFDTAAAKVPAICAHWEIPVPIVYPFPNPHTVNRRVGSGGMHFGLYTDNEIWVNVPDSSTPVTVRARAWSWPGNKTDRTASGILFHELGHHAQANVKMDPGVWRYTVDAFPKEAISGYEPTYDESFAETMRLFSSNPALLKLACPARHQFITRYFSPWHLADWTDILVNAPDFIISNAMRWAKIPQDKQRPV